MGHATHTSSIPLTMSRSRLTLVFSGALLDLSRTKQVISDVSEIEYKTEKGM